MKYDKISIEFCMIMSCHKFLSMVLISKSKTEFCRSFHGSKIAIYVNDKKTYKIFELTR